MPEFIKQDKMSKKLVTAAIVMINKKGDILAGHATGKPMDAGWDFPKGLVEEGEQDIIAAIRELREETGINIWRLENADLLDIGIFPHNKEKDIHIYLYQTEQFPDIDELKCTSYFELNGKQIPEVNAFKIISKEERHLFNKVLQNKFEIIDKYNETL